MKRSASRSSGILCDALDELADIHVTMSSIIPIGYGMSEGVSRNHKMEYEWGIAGEP